MSNAIKSLGAIAGIGQEVKEEKKEIKIEKSPYSPESVADEIGQLAGKRL